MKHLAIEIIQFYLPGQSKEGIESLLELKTKKFNVFMDVCLIYVYTMYVFTMIVPFMCLILISLHVSADTQCGLNDQQMLPLPGLQDYVLWLAYKCQQRKLSHA